MTVRVGVIESTRHELSEANGLPAMGWDEVDQSTAANPQQFHAMMREMGWSRRPTWT